jgi:polyhydroxyalkanoate synthase
VARHCGRRRSPRSAETRSGPCQRSAQHAPGDRRFAAAEWRELPYFALIKQAYLLFGQYLAELAALASLPEHGKQRLAFITKQYVDALAPDEFHGDESGGAEARALRPKARASCRAREPRCGCAAGAHLDERRKGFRGRAATSPSRPGSVVFRNELIEVLPVRADHASACIARPLVIVPPCINKYLRARPAAGKLLCRLGVGEGHTVFMISWRNIPPELGRNHLDDYLEHGVRTAICVAREITAENVNALGFCVGAPSLAWRSRSPPRAASRRSRASHCSTTMLDFEDPGEIGVYVTREALAAREPALRTDSAVRGSELGGAFASLRANDLVWNYVVHNYLKARRRPRSTSSTGTAIRRTCRADVSSTYIRNMYLDNSSASAAR